MEEDSTMDEQRNGPRALGYAIIWAMACVATAASILWVAAA